MIISKFVINAIATKLTKHFSLDKVMSYVFDDNELVVRAMLYDQDAQVIAVGTSTDRKIIKWIIYSDSK